MINPQYKGPTQDFGNTVETILKWIAKGIWALVDRIAPGDVANDQYIFNPGDTRPQGESLGPAGSCKTVAINGDFNSFLCSLTSGKVNLYWGNRNASNLPTVPDLVFGPTINPLPVPIMRRKDKHITLYVDPINGDAKGSLFIQYY